MARSRKEAAKAYPSYEIWLASAHAPGGAQEPDTRFAPLRRIVADYAGEAPYLVELTPAGQWQRMSPDDAAGLRSCRPHGRRRAPS